MRNKILSTILYKNPRQYEFNSEAVGITQVPLAFCIKIKSLYIT